eukprot:COSAG01_NODE_228_length_21104_cov_210.303832_6_plen_91_part_00
MRYVPSCVHLPGCRFRSACLRSSQIVDDCIAKLEAVGAIEACVVESREMVDAAWDKMDKILPDSFYKVHLHTSVHSAPFYDRTHARTQTR